MNAERTQAYRRVLGTLEDLGPAKLQGEEQERIRQAADALIFSTDIARDSEAQAALDDAVGLCRDLVASGRWEQATAHRLVADLRACGPAPAAGREAA
jgi:hypothetical protein